ncbi:hypothetical protein CDD82_4423 [Ophiocordyceps australis]|uniref:Bms1-type G domain-containing protein n=1 Tax=Ophiocordyceps australis TaxID=1399860 RepID=A0A2C5YXR8_9HYPO|nr:hypothetical protein CDD82_4423 [Ophiocordyceps australis]
MDQQVHKPHRKTKEKGKRDVRDRNPKAFASSNPGKLHKTAARSQDIREKRLHVPLVDRLPTEAPPRLVAIVGPPGVGKTTLLKSLIRRYAKETISDPQGPVTIVTSKKQRLTLLECPNQLEAMVDVAKVADIVLLMIDGNYGFEMETMEFLNILAATGMPGNVFGILTHLDLFRKPQALRDAKKRLKRRLWTELYQGAHLFYLSGVLNGRYPDREIHNLSRFLSVMKNPRPLVWRNSHPYAVMDSFRDMTHPAEIEKNPKCDRSILLSGYLRGINFAAQGQRVHVAGLGDFTVANIQVLPDPCPTPSMEQAMAKTTGKTGRRRLDDKEKKLYAPMSDRSGLKIDGDAIWITKEKGFSLDKDADADQHGEGEQMLVELQAERRLLGQLGGGVQLFSGGDELNRIDDEAVDKRKRRKVEFANQDDDLDMEEDEDSASEGGGNEFEPNQDEFSHDTGSIKFGVLGKGFDKAADGEDDIAFADSDSDLGSISEADDYQDESGEEEDEEVNQEGVEFGQDHDGICGEEAAALRWKNKLLDNVESLRHQGRLYHTADLARYIYDEALEPQMVLERWRGEENMDEAKEMKAREESDDDDLFTKAVGEETMETEDRHVPQYDYEQLEAKWADEDRLERLRRCRFTGRCQVEEGGLEEDEYGGVQDEGDGVYEDLEALEQAGKGGSRQEMEMEREKNAQRKEEIRRRFEEEDREGLLNDKANGRREGGETSEFGEDEWYEAQKAAIQKQLEINKEELEALDEAQRGLVEGFGAGKYAQVLLEQVPAEFVARFDARQPMVMGGLTATEDRWGLVQVRIKRHRWHSRVLKSNDALIFSLGWRRFQTLPLYSMSDSRTRNRMLKYTPEHMHCFGTMYAPLVAPNTGFVCFKSFAADTPGFRIAATGTVLSVDESSDIVKKLKLTGTPYKIYKNTAFVKDMFNSGLEIAKFEGAAIKTVSGVRGQIKRALAKPEGHFRATFEDKVLLSDIVLLRAWYPIKPHRFYNPAANLVGWQPMRLTGQVRRDEGCRAPQLKNSQYRPVQRETRHFNPLRVPRALAAELPFASQIVEMRKQAKPTYMQKRAVVLAPGSDEKKARALMTQLLTLGNEAAAKRRAKKDDNRAAFKKKMADNADKKEAREKRESKEYWRINGKKRSAVDQGGRGGSNKRR